MNAYNKLTRARAQVEKGFTLIEMLVVIIILGILAAYFGQTIFGQTNDVKINVAETAIATSFPSALMGFYSTHGYTATPLESAADSEQELVDRGVKPESPWGPVWSITAETSGHTAKKVTICYPTGDETALATKNAGIVKTKMSDSNTYPMIDSITVAATCGTSGGVNVVYDVN